MKGAGSPEPRPAASLTGGLLARRGGARPAMRRQPIINMHATSNPHEDLGWNDMGEESQAMDAAPPVAPVEAKSQTEPKNDEAAASSIAKQIDALAERMSVPVRKQPSRAKAQPAALAGAERKVAFTLRIDAERHLRLRLLSALTNRSAQQLLTEALDIMIAQNEALVPLIEQMENGRRATTAGKGKRKA